MSQTESKLSKISQFVEELFKKLNKDNIQYAVLRNYENIPSKPNDTDYFDLDLLVSSKDFKKYLKIIESLSSQLELQIIKKIHREYVKTIRIAHIDTNGKIDSVQLDSHISGQNWWGFFYLNEEDILNDRFIYESFYVVSEFHQHLFNWLDKLLWGNYVKEKYKDRILEVFSEKNEDLLMFLDKVFGRAISHQLHNKIKSGDLEGTLLFREKMISKIRVYSLLNVPLLTFISNIKFYYYEFLLYVFPPGLCCIINESEGPRVDVYFCELKKAVLGDQKILTYQGDSKIDWLLFYFREVFTIVRKGGLVLVLSSAEEKSISRIKMHSSSSQEEIFAKFLESNNKRNIMGMANIYLGNTLVK